MSFPLVPFNRHIGVESGRLIPANYTASDGAAVFVLGSDKPGVMVRATVPGIATDPDKFDVSQQGDLLSGTPVTFVRARVFIRAPTKMPKGIIWRFGARVDFDGLIGDALGRVIVNDINKNYSLFDIALPCRGQVTGTNSAIAFRLDVGGAGQQTGAALTILGYSSITYTVDTTLDLFTASAHGLADGDIVVAKTTGTLPAPLVVNKPYYVVDATTNTFRLSLTEGGGSIDITTAGTGTNTVSTQEQTIGGMYNQDADSVGRVIRITGAATGNNNGQFAVTKFLSDSSIKIRNTLGTGTDANSGSISWEFPSLELELPGVYIDSVVLDTTVERPTIINRAPFPGQTEVPANVSVFFELSDPSTLQSQIVQADTKIRLNGVLAYNGAAFQPGFTGSIVTDLDNLRTFSFAVGRLIPYPPNSVVNVQVESRVIGGNTIVYNYSFTIADTLSPQLAAAVAPDGRTIRVTWNEPVTSVSAAGTDDTLNPTLWTITRESKTLDDGLPSYLPKVVSVVEVSPSVYDLKLDDDLTAHAFYRLSATGIKDLFGNAIMQGLPVARTYLAVDCSPASSYMRLPFSASRKPDVDTFAYAFWVRVNSTLQSGSHVVAMYNEPDYTVGVLLNQLDGDLAVYINSGGPPSTTFSNFWGSVGFTWHRVVVYANRALGTISVYVDGSLFATNTIAPWSAITVEGTTGVGGSSSFGGAANFLFSDFCFHKGAVITAADVLADYHDDVRMPGLSSHLKLNEGTGTLLFESVAGPAGFFVGSPVWTSTDTPTIPDPHNQIVFEGFECLHPEDRDFELLEMIPDMNVSEDETRDLEAFIKCFQEVTDILLCDVDAWSSILDPDIAPESFVDAMLLDLGNPFSFDLGLNDKRRLIRVLVPIYQQKGTEEGIINAIRFFLGVEVTIEYPAFTGGWFLGVSELGVNNLLSTADLKTRLSFIIVSPIVLTDVQRDTMIKITEYMKDARTHLIKPIVEPTVTPPQTAFWIIGESLLGVDTNLGIPTPQLYAGLTLWLVSETGVVKDGTNRVSEWQDQSGGGHHFSESTTKPTWLASLATFGQRPCIDFDGVDDKFGTGPLSSTVLSVTAFEMFAVFLPDVQDKAPNAATSQCDGVVSSDEGTYGIYLDNTPQILGLNYDGTFDAVAIANTLGQPVVVALRHEGGNVTISVNGGTAVSVASGNTQAFSSNMKLGYSPQGSSTLFDGKLGEVVVYNQARTTAERTAIINYLKQKFFIT